ncbi:MAG: hypothetical protein JKX84_09495 [Flavobacteriales bacterium]|nr:hypothetical protein [Flavobacteriales bacterium]
MLSHDFGTANPPYFIQHIYSEGSERYKYVVFNLDNNLNVTSEKEEAMLQFDNPVKEMDGFVLRSAIQLQLMVAKQNIEKDKPYEAIIVLQELIHIDSTSTEAKALLTELLGTLKE